MPDVYLPGPVVCGFYGMFEANFGDPSTPAPYCRVTPSRVGTALLPFRCPRCGAAVDFTDPARRERFRDTRVVDGKRRDNYFCPSCGARFLINGAGRPHDGVLDDAGSATSVVERVEVGADGLVDVARAVRTARAPTRGFLKAYLEGTDVLGAM